MKRTKSNILRKELTDYLAKTFGKNSAMYNKMLGFELNKIKQQNSIQIPFITRYCKKDIRSVNVLDIGCGTGGATVAWALKGAECTGIDTSKEDIRIAIIRARYEGVKPVFKKMNGTDLPFKKETFDIIICDQVLEHIPEFEKTISEMRRVIKKDGIVYVDLPNRFFPHDPHFNLLFIHWLPTKAHRFMIKIFGKKYFDFPVFFRDYSSVKKAILKNKFKIIAGSNEFIKGSEKKEPKYAVAKMLVSAGIPARFFSPTMQFILEPISRGRS
jgi:ubiquinone/menaquinone biosynthesis C-methylase UbiE